MMDTVPNKSTDTSRPHWRPRIAIPTPSSIDADFNARAWPACAAAIERAGGEPVEVPLTVAPAEIMRIANTCQGVFLPGSQADVNPHKYGADPAPETGPADTARENADELLLQDAHNLYKPLLCVCFGTQSLNVWRTGTLVQHLAPMPVNHQAGRSVVAAHSVVIPHGSRLATALEGASDVEHMAGALRLSTNSVHHQAIGVVGDGLRVVASSPQDGVVEAVEGQHPGHFVLGLQWHPEYTQEESAASRAIFAHFLQVVREWQPRVVLESIG
jgi:putative glutamine amidotransferase